MKVVNASNRNALTAEYAFSLFAAGVDVAELKTKPSLGQDSSAWAEAVRRLRRYATSGLDLESALTSDESEEVSEILRRLGGCFPRARGQFLIARPLFSGCGFIDASEGDVIREKTIFEVKTVDRAFRSVDVRQLITYAALNYAAPRYVVESVGLFNPRRGIVCELDLESVSEEISGRPAGELLSTIVSSISSGDISR
jgi:hypothetical protein